MNEVIANFSNPAWWISVVIFGLILQLLGNYFQKGVDKLLSKLFVSWRNRSEKAKIREEIEIDDRLQEMINNQIMLVVYTSKENRYRITAVFFAIATLVVGAVSVIIIGITNGQTRSWISESVIYVNIIFAYYSAYRANRILNKAEFISKLVERYIAFNRQSIKNSNK